MEQKLVGKPMDVEAAALICELDDETLYTAAEIAAVYYDRRTQKRIYDRVRINLGQWARYHQLPTTFDNRDEDGNLMGRFPAWYGRTWKNELAKRDWINVRNWRGEPQLEKREIARLCPEPKPNDSLAPEKENREMVGMVVGRASNRRWRGVLVFAATVLILITLSSGDNINRRIEKKSAAKEISHKNRPSDILKLLDLEQNPRPARFSRRAHPKNFNTDWNILNSNQENTMLTRAHGGCILYLNTNPKFLMPSME